MTKDKLQKPALAQVMAHKTGAHCAACRQLDRVERVVVPGSSAGLLPLLESAADSCFSGQVGCCLESSSISQQSLLLQKYEERTGVIEMFTSQWNGMCQLPLEQPVPYGMSSLGFYRCDETV